MGSVNWLLKHGVYQDWQPVAEDEVSDEESSTHSPHQPQQVEGVQTGPLRHTGLASLDQTRCGGEIHSTKFQQALRHSCVLRIFFFETYNQLCSY